MNLYGLIIDFILVALLATSLFYLINLLGRLSDLRKDPDKLNNLIQDFTFATDQANKSLASIRTDSNVAGRELTERIEKGQYIISELQRSCDDLKMLIARAENAADKLEGQLTSSRHAQKKELKSSSDVHLVSPQDQQTQAFLSAIDHIR